MSEVFGSKPFRIVIAKTRQTVKQISRRPVNRLPYSLWPFVSPHADRGGATNKIQLLAINRAQSYKRQRELGTIRRSPQVTFVL